MLQDEKEYILATIPKTAKRGDLPLPPMISIFTNLPFMAIFVSHAVHNWGYFTLMTGIPLYLNNILHFSLTSVRRIIVSKD